MRKNNIRQYQMSVFMNWQIKKKKQEKTHARLCRVQGAVETDSGW